jgi:hypothetical protein
MSYEDTIAALAARHLSDPGLKLPLEALTVALGCSTIRRDGTTGIWSTTASPNPGVEHEQLVSDTLIRALQAQMHRLGSTYCGLSILGGLVTNDRWRRCIGNADDAYAMATLLVLFTDGMFSTVNDPFLPILNGWISSEVPITKYPGPRSLSELFFGRAWRSIVLEADDINGWEIPTLIQSTRPPFVPGLLAVSADVEVYALPPISFTEGH